MASKAVVPQQQLQQQPRGRGKQKNGPAEGRNRRVLQDIGNLVKVPAVEGKHTSRINRPITRRFCAQLLAKAQATEEKSKVDGGIAAKGVVGAQVGPETKSVVSRNEIEKPKSVSSNEQDESFTFSARKSRDSSLRTKVQAFTSVLTARSKAACGLTNMPRDLIANIDVTDVENELAVVEYVDDIYKFYKLTEDESRVHNYMDAQPDINAKMRSILVDWLIEVHNKFELMPETLYLTINIVDRFLSMKNALRRELQLVGICSMLIACKYEEISAPEVNDFVCISDNAYAREQVLAMEKAILRKLEWCLTVPTPYVFLVRYIKASSPSDVETENMAFFLAELGLMYYPTVVLYCPSMIAASAVYAARCTLDKNPSWSGNLKHYTGYSEDQLLDCAKLLVSFHSAAAEGKLKAVYRKYSKPERGAVVLRTPAKGLSAKSL